MAATSRVSGSPESDAVRPAGSSRPAIWMMVSAVLTAGMIAVAAYLTWVHYHPAALVCAVDGGCHTVQSSRYAMLGPVPVAALGLAMAVVVALLEALRWRRPALAPIVSIGIVGMLVGAVVYYGYLTHIELNVLDAICQWCVLSAILTVGLLVSEGARLWKQLADLPE